MKGEIQMTIKRNASYIKFVAAVRTNASEVGDVMEAWRDDYGWHTRKEGSEEVFGVSAVMLRTIGGEVLEMR